MCVDLSYSAVSNRCLLRHSSSHFVDILLSIISSCSSLFLEHPRLSFAVLRQNIIRHVLHRKEVIQPHLPIRLPCYDFTPIIGPTLDGWLLKGYPTGFGCYQLSWCDVRCVQGPGTYSPQYADLRLLAIPTSRRRVAACDPN